MAWTTDNIRDLTGTSVIVTGANSGIGLVAARELAAKGAKVTLAVRSTEKGEAALRTIDGDATVRRLDLADLASIRTFAEETDEDVDILINNAGLMAVPESRTADGFEMQIGTNHLGHFALTNMLLPKLTRRVTTVASGAHRAGKIDLDDLNWRTRSYDRWRAYGQSKLANLLFTLELQRRLDEAGSRVKATAAHPGYSATNLQSRTGNVFQNTLMAFGNKVIAQSDAMGALPTLFAAVEDIPGASYVGPSGFMETRGHPTLVARSGRASDVETAKKLWTLSEELTGATFPLATASV